MQVTNRFESHHQYSLPETNHALHSFLLDWRQDHVLPLCQITSKPIFSRLSIRPIRTLYDHLNESDCLYLSILCQTAFESFPKSNCEEGHHWLFHTKSEYKLEQDDIRRCQLNKTTLGGTNKVYRVRKWLICINYVLIMLFILWIKCPRSWQRS